MSQRRVTFLPDSRSSLFEEGVSLREAALELGLLIDSSCAGIGTCGECRVRVQGEVSGPTATELGVLSADELRSGFRLSCQALIQGDCVCVLPDKPRTQGLVILERGRSTDFPLAPELAPDAPARPYGIALDVGTTTVVAKLINLASGEIVAVASELNAQEGYGADVISRAKYVIDHEAGLRTLHRLIVDQVNRLATNLCGQVGVQTAEIYRGVVVGNTIMQHLFAGLDPRDLASAPFTPAYQGPLTLRARDLGLDLNPSAAVYLPPNLACYVGADITAVLTTLDLDASDDLQLAVDVGTNGELALGRNGRIMCCSSPAGPAWEGATISWGMRAAHGAIERVDWRDGSLAWRTIGNLPPAGLCGSGLMDLIALLVRAGAVDSAGRLLRREDALQRLEGELATRIVNHENQQPALRITPAAEGKWIELTQRDIRELQLAKAAIASAIEILISEFGAQPSDLARVYVAGAFGNHIRGEDAVDIGLLPPVPPERIHFIGNAAVSGAEAILRSREAREKAERLARRIEYIELAARPDFQDRFATALLFPGRQ